MKKETTKQRILKHVLKSEIELYPKQISDQLGINHNTVKVHLRRLLAEGKILQPYKGSYVSQIGYGMMLSPLRVHNVVVSVDAPWLDFSDDLVEWTGDVKLRVQFGLQRRRVTGRVSCGGGMGRDTLLFVLNRFYDLFLERTGRGVERVVVKTFELNRDVAGVRLDGAKCFTRKGLDGMIDRVYQKGDVVRSEVKISKEMGVDDFLALMQGGVSSYNVTQAQFVIAQKVDKLAEAIKYNNELGNRMYKVMVGILKRLNRIDGLE